MKKLIVPAIFSCLLFTLHIQVAAQNTDTLLLKNYHPVSIYGVPASAITKAAFPVMDMHSHDYAKTATDINEWIKNMDAAGIEKTIILTQATGKEFDTIVDKYSAYPTRFLLFCGFDYTGFNTPGWQQKAVTELERCYRKGARGIGELGDKGEGELNSKPTPGRGIHIDNPALKPLLAKCADLKMPVIIHVAEDRWMYEAPDAKNDGLMNGSTWHVNMNVPGKLNHDELIKGLENAVRENPKTTFVACHLANCCSNLQQLAELFDKYPNLYADIAARFGEVAPIPRYTANFITRYQDRLVYGTDMGMESAMYNTTFRILETADEHFYDLNLFNYHWALYGLDLPKKVLLKLYKTNADKILHQH